MRCLCGKRTAALAAGSIALVVLATAGKSLYDEHQTQRASILRSNGGGQRLRGDTWVDTDSTISKVFRRLASAGREPQGPPRPYFSDDEASEFPEVVPETEEHSHAWHKPLHPIDGWDVAGVGLACIGLMIAAAGGIGGGGILVPLYILVLGFHPKHAIPLSNITIFGGAITNTVLNLSKRHPDADRPLVDWDLILVMEPLTIGGALVGSFINKVWSRSGSWDSRNEVQIGRSGLRHDGCGVSRPKPWSMETSAWPLNLVDQGQFVIVSSPAEEFQAGRYRRCTA